MSSRSELEQPQSSNDSQPLETEDITPVIDIPSLLVVSDEDLKTIEDELVRQTDKKAIVIVTDGEYGALVATVFNDQESPRSVIYEPEVDSLGVLHVSQNEVVMTYNPEDGVLTFNFQIAAPRSVSLTIIPGPQLLTAAFPTFEGAEATYIITGNVFTTNKDAPEDDGLDHLEVALAENDGEVTMEVLSQDPLTKNITRDKLLKFLADYKNHVPALDRVMGKLQELYYLNLAKQNEGIVEENKAGTNLAE